MLQRLSLGSLAVVLAVAGGLVAIPAAACGETRLGVQGGAVFSTLVWSSENTEEGLDAGTLTGLSAGIIFDADIGSRVWLRLAPRWVERGSTIAFDFFGTQAGRFELGYLELPVTFNVSLTSGSVRPYLAAGGAPGYLARARTVAVRADGEESQDAGAHFRDWDFGVTIGVGLEFVGEHTRGFVEGGHTWGLSNLWVDETLVPIKNRSWQLLAGVTLQL